MSVMIFSGVGDKCPGANVLRSCGHGRESRPFLAHCAVAVMSNCQYARHNRLPAVRRSSGDNGERKCADTIGTVLVPGLAISNAKM